MALEQTLIGGGSMVVGKARANGAAAPAQQPLAAPASTPVNPKKAPGVPRARAVEEAARDEALERVAAGNKSLIDEARTIAHEIARERGSVTSTEVFAEMNARDPKKLRGVEPRFMGVVFRGSEWEPLDWSGKGSHRRPVRRWKLRA